MFVEISETGIMSFLCDSRVQQVLQNFCQKNRPDAPLDMLINNMLIDDTEYENDFPGDSLPDGRTTMEDLDEELENIRQERELHFLNAARLTQISQAGCSGTLSALPDNVTKALAIIRQKVAEIRDPQARPSEAVIDRATAVLVHIYSTAHGEGSQSPPPFPDICATLDVLELSWHRVLVAFGPDANEVWARWYGKTQDVQHMSNAQIAEALRGLRLEK
jgi:hypothetical protein